ncbi:MAG: class I SAM-dependent methyltransferase [Candidatus Freyarchaeota archaeon]
MTERKAEKLWRKLVKPVVPGSKKLYELYRIYTFLGVKRGELLLDLLERFSPTRGRFFLDVGCGAGGLAIAFTKRSLATVAFDVDPRYLEVARVWGEEEGVELNLLLASGENMPFRGGSFDFVACSDLIEHVHNPDKLAEEVARVLRSGGFLYLTCPNRISPRLVWRDNHYLLPFFTLLPRRMADCYVKATKRGESNEVFFLPTYPRLVKMFEKVGVKLYSRELEEKIREAERALSFLKETRLYKTVMHIVEFALKHFYVKWICPIWIFIGRRK